MPRKKGKKTKYRYVTRVKRRWRKTDKRIPIATAVPFLKAMAAEPLLGDGPRLGAIKMYQNTKNPMDALLEGGNILAENFTGFSMKGPDAGTFHFEYPLRTYGLILAGGLISKYVGKYVNPRMKKVPILGKYVKV